jgi:hypothetical protein
MHNIVLNDTSSQPICFVVVHDKTTDIPVFALTNYGLGEKDSDIVNVRGYPIPIRMTAEGMSYTENIPTSLGYGLSRREFSFTIKEGGPFAVAPFTPALYSAGSSTDKFYFSVWAIDFVNSLKDLAEYAMFLGYYDLDVGLSWDEASTSTTIRLVDRLTNLTGRYNNNTESAEELLAGSEWQSLLTAPAYLGFRTKVPVQGRTAATISGFDVYNKAVLGVVGGLVQSQALSGTSLQLGKSPTLAQLVGNTAKLKMGNGCIISGTITDLGGGNYGINTTGMSLNVAWDTVVVYNKGWTAVGDALNAVTTDLTSIFIDNTQSLTKIPSPNMYIKTPSTVELYNGGPVATAGALFCKLTGVKDEANKELGCEQLKDPANVAYKYGGVSVEFDAIQQSIAWSGDDAHLNYAKWLDKQTCSLYFTNKTYVLADIQKQGMPWELIITPHVNSAVVLEYVYYVRLMGDTTLAESATGSVALYASDGSTLHHIPNKEIDTIAYGNTDFGMVDLCKITLNRRLTDINESYDESVMYIDTSRVMYAGEVITYILEEAGIGLELRDFSLRTGTNKLGNSLSLSITNETWSDVLDSVLFESGLRLDVGEGFYSVVPSFNETLIRTFNNVADPTQTFMYVSTTDVISFGDVIDGTYKMEIGRALTNIDADGREYVRTHCTYKYTYSMFNGQNQRMLQSVKAPKSNDRIVTYDFKHICDTATATAAAIQMTRIGHVATIPDSTRKVTVGLPFTYMRAQVLDSVRLVNFRHITAQDDPLPAYDPSSTTNPVYTLGALGPYARYTSTVPYMLIPGIGIIDTVVINFSGEGVPVTLTFRQVQPGSTSNLRSVASEIQLNTDSDNATDPNTAVINYPTNSYKCPADIETTTVSISTGDAQPGGPAIADPCCNNSTSTSDAESDMVVTVTCTNPLWNPDDPWPDACIDNSNVYYEPETDTEIGSTDTLIYDIYTFNDTCPTLISIKYPGQSMPDGCVSYADLCTTGEVIIGKLYVSPCIFDTPIGMYTKYIELTFMAVYCHRVRPKGLAYKSFPVSSRKLVHLTVPVSLRPVSDINIG